METIKKASVVEIGRVKTEILKFRGKDQLLDCVCLDLSKGYIITTDKKRLYVKKINVKGEMKDIVLIPSYDFKRLGSRFIVANGNYSTEFRTSYEFLTQKGESFEIMNHRTINFPNYRAIDFCTSEKLHYSFSENAKKDIIKFLKSYNRSRIELRIDRGNNYIRLFDYDEKEKARIKINETSMYTIDISLEKKMFIDALSTSSPAISICIDKSYKYIKAVLFKTRNNANVMVTCSPTTDYGHSLVNIERKDLMHYTEF